MLKMTTSSRLLASSAAIRSKILSSQSEWHRYVSNIMCVCVFTVCMRTCMHMRGMLRDLEAA